MASEHKDIIIKLSSKQIYDRFHIQIQINKVKIKQAKKIKTYSYIKTT